MSDFPSWLKSAQNGSIGEIRTKAFLMDRFWVLERSVDIESADFLIQRRLHGKHILDQNAPRFGVIQAKFSQNEKTLHRVKKQDLLNKDGSPHIEFFLIIHTGDEEDQQMFLLTAKDISENFLINADGKYEVSSRAVFASPKYLINSRKNCLDRIENSIQCAEFYKNRAFVFSRLDTSSSPDFDAILPEYKEKISDYWHADIPARFKELKKEAFDAMLQIEEAYALLKSFIESVDPLEAIVIAETLDREVKRIHLPEIFISDMYYDSKNFKEKIQDLRADGLLDNYISARKDLIDSINCFLQSYPTDQLSKNSIHEIEIEYDPVALRFIRATNKIVIPEEQPYSDFNRIVEAKEGKIVLSWKIGLQFVHDGRIGMNGCCIHEIMKKMYGLKYYEDEEIVS
jgi:hypothetical protein